MVRLQLGERDDPVDIREHHRQRQPDEARAPTGVGDGEAALAVEIDEAQLLVDQHLGETRFLEHQDGVAAVARTFADQNLGGAEAAQRPGRGAHHLRMGVDMPGAGGGLDQVRLEQDPLPGDGGRRDADLGERVAQDRFEVDGVRSGARHADPRSQVAPAAGEPADRSGGEDRAGGEQLAPRRLPRDQPVAAHADSRRAARSPRGEHRATASSASSALS